MLDSEKDDLIIELRRMVNKHSNTINKLADIINKFGKRLAALEKRDENAVDGPLKQFDFSEFLKKDGK